MFFGSAYSTSHLILFIPFMIWSCLFHVWLHPFCSMCRLTLLIPCNMWNCLFHALYGLASLCPLIMQHLVLHILCVLWYCLFHVSSCPVYSLRHLVLHKPCILLFTGPAYGVCHPSLLIICVLWSCLLIYMYYRLAYSMNHLVLFIPRVSSSCFLH